MFLPVIIIQLEREGGAETDPLHLIENTFDRKRIYVNPSSYPNPNSNPNPKAQ